MPADPLIIHAYESFKHSNNSLSIKYLKSFAPMPSAQQVAARLRPREVVAKLVLAGDLAYG